MKYLSKFLIIFGAIFIFISIVIFTIIFLPVIKEEIKYQAAKNSNTTEIKPVDKIFSIVIPKIGANSKIVKDVDPFNSIIYQAALAKGVAHAKGTGYPKENKNIFLFSHSSANLFEASRYNSVFYLIEKLEKDDEINIYYNFEKIPYKVVDKKIVNANEVKYLNPGIKEEKLTLMTCWPAGTAFKRLIIIAKPDK